MKNVLGNNAPSYIFLKKWAAEFQFGYTNFENDLHNEHPNFQ